MRNSIATIALRRSLGRMFFVVLLAIEMVALFAHGVEWKQLWVLSASHVAGGTIIVGPVAAAAGAAAFVEQRKRELLLPVGAQLRDSLVRLAALVAWVLIAHVATACIAYILTAVDHEGLGPYDLRLVFVSSLALVAYTGLGALVGRWIPQWPTVPLVAVGSYSLVFLVTSRMDLILVGGATGVGGMVGKEYSAGPLASQATWFAGLSIAAAGILVCQVSRVASVTAVLGVFIAASVYATPHTTEELTPRQPADLACMDNVCVDREVRGHLEAVHRAVVPLRNATTALTSGLAGTAPVKRVVAISPFPLSPGTAAIGWSDDGDRVDVEGTAWALLQTVSSCTDDQMQAEAGTGQSAAEWLITQAGHALGPGTPSPSRQSAREALVNLVSACR